MINIQVADYQQLKKIADAFSGPRSKPIVLFVNATGETEPSFSVVVITEQAFISHKFTAKPEGFDHDFSYALAVHGVSAWA